MQIMNIATFLLFNCKVLVKKKTKLQSFKNFILNINTSWYKTSALIILKKSINVYDVEFMNLSKKIYLQKHNMCNKLTYINQYKVSKDSSFNPK